MDEFGRARSDPSGDALVGRRHHLGTTKDDYYSVGRPSPAVYEPNDAVDDAHNVRGIYVAISSWSGGLHTLFKHRRRGNSILRRRQTTNRIVRSIIFRYRSN